MKRTGKYKKCLVCFKEFYIPNWWLKKGGKYCSRECYWKNKHDIPWNKGTKGLIKANDGSFSKGITHWKGTISEYKSLHFWVGRYLGKPKKCEVCDKEELGKGMHWANKSGEYKKEKGDWIRLCAKCHYKFDKQYERRQKYKK